MIQHRVRTLFPDSPRRVRRPEAKPISNGIETSDRAADRVAPKVSPQARRVWAFVRDRGSLGATDAEISTMLGLKENTARPRRVWLRDNGFLMRKMEMGHVVTRNRSQVWVFSGKALPDPVN